MENKTNLIKLAVELLDAESEQALRAFGRSPASHDAESFYDYLKTGVGASKAKVMGLPVSELVTKIREKAPTQWGFSLRNLDDKDRADALEHYSSFGEGPLAAYNHQFNKLGISPARLADTEKWMQLNGMSGADQFLQRHRALFDEYSKTKDLHGRNLNDAAQLQAVRDFKGWVRSADPTFSSTYDKMLDVYGAAQVDPRATYARLGTAPVNVIGSLSRAAANAKNKSFLAARSDLLDAGDTLREAAGKALNPALNRLTSGDTADLLPQKVRAAHPVLSRFLPSLPTKIADPIRSKVHTVQSELKAQPDALRDLQRGAEKAKTQFADLKKDVATLGQGFNTWLGSRQ